MTANYVLLEKITVGAVGASSVTFSNIPQTGYTDLVIKMSARTTRGYLEDSALMRFNGDSGSNYARRSLYGDGATSGSYGGTYTNIDFFINADTATASIFGNAEIYISNYTSANYKPISVDTVTENNATTALAQLNAGIWNSTAAITSISITPNSNPFMQYSTFYLYGVAKLGTTPEIVPYATGGDTIMTDGTYWYHAFLSSGTFTPAKGLSCDYLLVAGGGAGGKGTPGVCWGGGGGAGGIQFGSTSLTATSYPIVIGGGGTGSSTAGVSGTNGVSTTAFSLTAGAGNGGAGGSGNGGNSGTPQSFLGVVSNVPGGGGGGSNANASTANGGNGIGGTGFTNFAILNAMGAATNTGQLSSSNYYYSGGGGSGFNNTPIGPGLGGLGGGGNGAEAGQTPQSGAPNTGGGGGAMRGDDAPTAGNGGSGLVIVRYAV